ncbi:ABC transporter ATP-binding protein [Aureibacillus halotolerans]|uniref:Peptide/nickel transport system ATP-binding protein n=1 Tax=Aureibacillus halotolerans TaxID=1508390 RepID=A0A4V3D509_9BACI|nr:ABC transporter ATP-binding protein [Aureibacillus halotolerans]TDQ38297.1 peptide/nickel transport system ATP-binding protein [Aureibacillus halotolerans]
MNPLLKVHELSVGFQSDQGVVKAIEDVSFEVHKGQTLCIVGESGSGKSVTSMSIMRLIDYENGVLLGGDIEFNGESLSTKSQDSMRKIRGNQMSMIFQEPMTALNPVFSVGKQIVESLRLQNKRLSKSESWAKAVELLQQVGISEPHIRVKQFPHELSGGMRQRVMIAIALASNPQLLIADEPTTALDVTIQSQILHLLAELKETTGMSMILITHDIGVAAEISDRIVVMYAGTIVEEGDVFDIFEQPKHPYTVGLFESVPVVDGERKPSLPSIPGTIPSLANLPEGCRFHPRCPYATEQCVRSSPPLVTLSEGRKVACFHHDIVDHQNSLTKTKKEVVQDE